MWNRRAKATIKEAIEQLSGSLLLRLGAMPMDEPLPDLVYGSDGEELRATLDDLNLVAYVGVMPHLRKVPQVDDTSSDLYPYALGHSLFLEIMAKDL